mgnify:CR=1 FL=1
MVNSDFRTIFSFVIILLLFAKYLNRILAAISPISKAGCVIVVNDGLNETMIPLVDDFLIQINRDKKTLTFDLQEGLTTL